MVNSVQVKAGQSVTSKLTVPFVLVLLRAISPSGCPVLLTPRVCSRNPVRAITEQLEDLRLHLSSDYPNSGSVLPDTPEFAHDPVLNIDPFPRAGTEAVSHVDAKAGIVAEHASNTSVDAGPQPDFIVRSANSTSKSTSGLGFDTIAATLPDLTKFNASISEPETVEPETVEQETVSPKAVEAESVDAEIAASDFSLPSDASASPQEENLDEVSVDKRICCSRFCRPFLRRTSNVNTPTRVLRQCRLFTLSHGQREKL